MKEDINLASLKSFFKKGIKKILIISIIFTIIISFIIMYFRRPFYYSGSVSFISPLCDQFIFSPLEINSLLSSDSFIDELAIRCDLRTDYIKDKININYSSDSKIITINFKNKGEAKVFSVIKNLLDMLDEIVTPIFDIKYSNLESEIELLNKQITDAKNYLNKLSNDMDSISKTNFNKVEYMLEYSLLDSTYNSIYQKLMSLEDKRVSKLAILNEAHKFNILNPIIVTKHSLLISNLLIIISVFILLVVIFMILNIFKNF